MSIAYFLTLKFYFAHRFIPPICYFTPLDKEEE